MSIWRSLKHKDYITEYQKNLACEYSDWHHRIKQPSTFLCLNIFMAILEAKLAPNCTACLLLCDLHQGSGTHLTKSWQVQLEHQCMFRGGHLIHMRGIMKICSATFNKASTPPLSTQKYYQPLPVAHKKINFLCACIYTHVYIS